MDLNCAVFGGSTESTLSSAEGGVGSEAEAVKTDRLVADDAGCQSESLVWSGLYE